MGDVSMCYTYNVCSRLPTQLEHGKEKKLYEELETGRTSTVVAPSLHGRLNTLSKPMSRTKKHARKRKTNVKTLTRLAVLCLRVLLISQ
jgi:hypothetical protein